MSTASLLRYHDRCARAGWRFIRQVPGPIGAWGVLREAIETGLAASDYRSERAASVVREAALHGRLKVDPPTAIFSISEHLAAIAEQVVYTIGGDRTWERPEHIRLDQDTLWESGAFLDGPNLRRIGLTDYWSESKDQSESMSWHTSGEQAIYDCEMTELIVILGQHRDERFHGLWSKGWKHPRNSEIRLHPVSGGEFKNYEPFWREDLKIPCSKWAELMPTGLAIAVRKHEPLDLNTRKRWKHLAMAKLKAIKGEREPLPQISQCFTPSRCPFGPCEP